MKRSLLSIAAFAGVLAGCSSPSPYPTGWQPAPGASGTWVSQSGPGGQTYTLVKKQYNGSLQDLGEEQAAAVVQKYHGARLTESVTFDPCPGRAAVANFTYGKSQAIQQAFATDNGVAVLVTYIRPAGTQADPAASQAMEHALCSTTT